MSYLRDGREKESNLANCTVAGVPFSLEGRGSVGEAVLGRSIFTHVGRASWSGDRGAYGTGWTANWSLRHWVSLLVFGSDEDITTGTLCMYVCVRRKNNLVWRL